MEVLHKARVLHAGWEMDNDLSVVALDTGEIELRTTSHGEDCLMTAASLEEKIAETWASLQGLEKAKAMLIKGNKKRGC
jgi:hypothetical protein